MLILFELKCKSVETQLYHYLPRRFLLRGFLLLLFIITKINFHKLANIGTVIILFKHNIFRLYDTIILYIYYTSDI